MILFYHPNCDSCKKAKKWLTENEQNHTKLTIRPLLTEAPSPTELKAYVQASDQPFKKFFNTSGKLYREMNMKEKVQSENQDTLIQLLSENPMLIKRPLLSYQKDGEERVLIGFKPEIWAEALLS